MLALSRKVGESIVIDDNITITVISVSGEQVKLGIEAPKQIKIYREEIQEQIRQENKAAMEMNNSSTEAFKNLIRKK